MSDNFSEAIAPYSEQLPILIVGGGIAGLTLALELGRRNIACLVLEQSDEISEFGAGLQLSPNAVKRLKLLGIDISLAAAISTPNKIVIHDAIDNSQLNEVPLGQVVLERCGAPYWVIARQELQTILLDAVNLCPGVEILLGQKFTTYTQDADSITAIMENGESYKGRLLVGADGIWSRVRHMISKEAVPVSTGLVAWRSMVSVANAPKPFLNPDTQVWLGPDSHLVQYRVAAGEMVNLVAVTKGKAQQRSWHAPLPKEKFFEAIRPWSKDLRRAVMEIEEWVAWPLMILRPFQPWSKRRMMLMGDAAHAVVPFLAQGAAMGIEDAALLGALLAEHRDDVEAVPPLFEKLRFSRCRRVLSKSLFNVQLYHARSIYRTIRNVGLKAMPQSLLLRQYDWLYKG